MDACILISLSTYPNNIIVAINYLCDDGTLRPYIFYVKFKSFTESIDLFLLTFVAATTTLLACNVVVAVAIKSNHLGPHFNAAERENVLRL